MPSTTRRTSTATPARAPARSSPTRTAEEAIRLRNRERRRAPRAPGGFMLAIATPLKRRAVPVKDISRSGVCCDLPFPIPVMTRVRIELELPAGILPDTPTRRIPCEGAVVRCEPVHRSGSGRAYDVAIFFLSIPTEGRAAIEEYVSSKLRD